MSEGPAAQTPPTCGSTALTVPILQRRLRVARGEEPGDLLLAGGSVVNVFNGRVERANVVLADGWIAGVGPYGWEARRRIELAGEPIIPGLIDGHMHLESTLLTPAELARVVVPHGTAAIIADPHEIGNVLGVRGIQLLLAASAGLPLDIFFMAPSCVPATSWEDAGAVLDAAAVGQLLQYERVLGLAEVMDFPAVLRGQAEVLDKLVAADGHGGAVDGHAPGLSGRELMSYVAAGIRSDHESTTVDEALAKGALGMLVQVREGSSARNLEALLPLLVEDRLGAWCLATDDVHPDDVLRGGHLNGHLRRLVAAGVPPVRAVRHATLVPAQHYGLRHHGAVAPGYRGHLAVLGDLTEFRAQYVVHGGVLVARDGEYLWDTTPPRLPAENTVRLGALAESDFSLVVAHSPWPVIGLEPGQIVTRRLACDFDRVGQPWTFAPQRDLALLACLERHRATGRKGLGLVQGFNFQKQGALGSSVGHDSHNLLIVGTQARDMLAAVRWLESTGGGFVVVEEGRVVAGVPLPVAGLLSTDSAVELSQQLEHANRAAAALGCPLAQPFGTLSFLALPVIPELRLTAKGLFDVLRQEFVEHS
jgi:adenine deaminase